MRNPIYKHAPEEYFPAAPALEVARAVRADNVAALDQVFAQHPNLDPNQAGRQGVTFLILGLRPPPRQDAEGPGGPWGRPQPTATLA